MELSDKDEDPTQSYNCSSSYRFYELLRQLYGATPLTDENIRRLIPIKEKYEKGDYTEKKKGKKRTNP